MFTKKKLKKLSKTTTKQMDLAELADVLEIRIRPSLSTDERKAQYLKQVKNPYCMRVGTTKVKVEFSPEGQSLDTLLAVYFARRTSN